MKKGMRIRILREKAGFTQTELAEKIGVSKQTLYKYENDIITNVPSDKIEAIAEVTGYSPEYIMGWKDIADIILERPTLDEESLLKDYHLLNEQGKQHARDYIAYLVTKEEFKEETNA